MISRYSIFARDASTGARGATPPHGARNMQHKLPDPNHITHAHTHAPHHARTCTHRRSRGRHHMHPVPLAVRKRNALAGDKPPSCEPSPSARKMRSENDRNAAYIARAHVMGAAAKIKPRSRTRGKACRRSGNLEYRAATLRSAGTSSSTASSPSIFRRSCSLSTSCKSQVPRPSRHRDRVAAAATVAAAAATAVAAAGLGKCCDSLPCTHAAGQRGRSSSRGCSLHTSGLARSLDLNYKMVQAANASRYKSPGQTGGAQGHWLQRPRGRQGAGRRV